MNGGFLNNLLKDPGVEQGKHDFLQRRVDGIEARDGGAAVQGFENIRQVFFFDPGVPNLLRMNDDIGSEIATAKADIRFHIDVNRLFGDLTSEVLH